MKILITGATGFVGTALISELSLNNKIQLKVLTRDKKKHKNKWPEGVNLYDWRPDDNEIDIDAVIDTDIIVHLSGESIANGRWTKNKKQKIVDSRIMSTELLLKTIKLSKHTPKNFIISSAIGFYGNRYEEHLLESSLKGTGFLSDLCGNVESKLLNHGLSNMRTCILRTGIVLGKNGGALAKMITPFRLGMGGRFGSGKQYMSWIHIQDLINIILFLIDSKNSCGIYNTVSPQPITNSIFTMILGKVMHRPVLLPVPAIFLKVLLGEMSDILLDSQRVYPEKLLNNDYRFKFSDLETAFIDLCKI